VARRQGAEARLLGGLGGTGEEPFVLAEFQGDVQGLRRGRGHVSSSVFRDKGVLPDGDWYHLGYRAAYMVSPGRPGGRPPGLPQVRTAPTPAYRSSQPRCATARSPSGPPAGRGARTAPADPGSDPTRADPPTSGGTASAAATPSPG